jgi:hypothetical protein
VLADFEFYSVDGTIKGGREQLQVSDFWYLDALAKVHAKLGRLS